MAKGEQRMKVFYTHKGKKTLFSPRYNLDKVNMPNKPGLYCLGCVEYNFISKEHLYWVKVGVSTRELSKRVKSYSTCNPSFFTIDFLATSRSDCLLEKQYHNGLAAMAINIPQQGDEWFAVEEEVFLKIYNEGFRFLKKVRAPTEAEIEKDMHENWDKYSPLSRLMATQGGKG